MICKTPTEVLLADALETLLRSRPLNLGCSDFDHAKKDQHADDTDCPCLLRWERNVEIACSILKREP